VNSCYREDAKSAKELLWGDWACVASMVDRMNQELERLATELVDAAFTVHSALGPGLLESAYQACLVHELRRRGLSVQCEVPLPVHYAGLAIDVGYRVDMMLESAIIIENESSRTITPVHVSQLLTYLKLTDKRLGFLINWNVPRIKDGIKRLANGL
jgi:GxxExxY protein